MMESVQRATTRLISGLKELSYEQRLRSMGLTVNIGVEETTIEVTVIPRTVMLSSANKKRKLANLSRLASHAFCDSSQPI